MATQQQINARRVAYQKRVRQAGSVKAAEQNMREVSANYKAGLAAGLTPGQAATTLTLPKYTVKDGDTIATIAQNAGTTPEAILQNNPDLTTPKAGMILDTGNMQSQTSQIAQQFAPKPVAPVGGLPSNAAFGQTTTNPTGTGTGNPAQEVRQRTSDFSTSPLVKAIDFIKSTFTPSTGDAAQNNYYSNYMQGQTSQIAQQYSQRPPAIAQPAPTTQPKGNINILPVQTSPNTNPQNAIQGPFGASENASMANILNTILAETGPTGRMATDYEMNLLKYYSAITQSTTQQAVTPKSGGGYGYSSRGFGRSGGGGGGGGGGANKTSGGGYGQSTPAFASGSSAFGLINWRI